MTEPPHNLAQAAFDQASRHLHTLGLPDPRVSPPLALLSPGAPQTELLSDRAGHPEEGQGRPGGPPRHEPSRTWEGLTVTDALSAMASGQMSCRELVADALARQAKTAELGTVVALDEEAVWAQAERLDAERLAGRQRGPLHGVPVTVKDIIDVAGLPTRAGSAAYDNEPTEDAPAVARLRHAGALILAKVATHEFALGVTTPQCSNPHDSARIAGGSSGGSAIAVQTGVGLGSLGTDTRASLRVPAALCGVVGFKPTFGRVPATGIVPLSWTIDHLGPITRTVTDAALLLDVLADGPALGPSAPGRRGVVAVVTGAFDDAAPQVRKACTEAVSALAEAGWQVTEASVPSLEDLELSNDLGLLVSRAEASTFHRGQGTNVDLCIPEVRDQLRAGLNITAADYLDAQRQRDVLCRRALSQFAFCDIIAMPTSPVVAPLKSDYERYLLRLSRNTILWSLAGTPAVSVPCGTAEHGLPVGLQLVAAPGHDHMLASCGAALEHALAGS